MIGLSQSVVSDAISLTRLGIEVCLLLWVGHDEGVVLAGDDDDGCEDAAHSQEDADEQQHQLDQGHHLGCQRIESIDRCVSLTGCFDVSARLPVEFAHLAPKEGGRNCFICLVGA